MSYCHKTFDVLFLAFGYFCTGFVSCASRQACGFCALWSEWAMSTLLWGGWAPLQAWTLFLCPQLEVPWEKQATMHLVWWAVVALEERFSGVILWILRTPSPNQRCFREGGVLQASFNGVPWTMYPVVARVHVNCSGGSHCFRFTGRALSSCTPRLVCDTNLNAINQCDLAVCLNDTVLIQTRK